MTTVTIKGGDYIEITVKGHADYNPGNDIVCAGISTLAYALLNYLSDASEIGLIDDFTYSQKSGYIYMRFRSKMIAVGKIGGAVGMFQTGAEMLEWKYPEHIKVEVEP